MKIGKVPENVLRRSVFKELKVKRSEVIVGPSLGIDCSALQFEENELCVLSTDPITAAVHDIGSLAIHITANDLAASGAEAVGVMLTLLLPPDFLEEDLKKIMKDIDSRCQELNLQVIGGHTEVTQAVNQPIISVTGVGKVKRDKLIRNEKAEPGQDIVMTKWAGIEGTTIIAKAYEKRLKAHYNSGFIEKAKSLGQYLSVTAEGRIGAE